MSLVKICFESLPSSQRSSLEWKWREREGSDAARMNMTWKFVYIIYMTRKREREREMSLRKCRGQCQISLHDPVQPWKGTKEHVSISNIHKEWMTVISVFIFFFFWGLEYWSASKLEQLNWSKVFKPKVQHCLTALWCPLLLTQTTQIYIKFTSNLQIYITFTSQLKSNLQIYNLHKLQIYVTNDHMLSGGEINRLLKPFLTL